MGRDVFIQQLRELGLALEEPEGGFVTFSYEIPVGRFAGKLVKVGFQLNDDLPANPPGGPHFSPQLLPIDQKPGTHPNNGVHPSSLGPEWQYWSRPFSGWGKSDRSAKAYMAHVRALLDFQ